MRVLGAVLFLAGSGATVYSVRASFASARPRDVLLALVAPIALLVALTGALLVFVPGFFG